MNFKLQTIFPFIFILLITACGTSKKLVKKEVTLDTVTVSAKNSLYRATSPTYWDFINTRVSLKFNWNAKTTDGDEWIDLHPHFYAMDSLVLDAKSMEIGNVFLTKGKGYPGTGYLALPFQYYNDQLHIHFNEKLFNADTVQIYIHYKAMPNATISGGSSAITDDKGLYFINTDNSVPGKPMQIWTQGETESNSHWMPTVDKPNNRFTTRIELYVPDSMQTLSNGYLGVQEKLKDGMRKDIWIMDKPIQAYAVMFAIGRFDITKDEWRGRDVNYYVEKDYSANARHIFNYTPEMIEYFSKATGVNYPWNKYNQIIVRDYISGAMENTSATLFGEFMNQTSRELLDRDFEDVVSHELFHQWFGDYVTCESWSNITLNESFANYGEQLWRRFKHGENAADRLAYQDLVLYLTSEAKTADSPLVRYYYNDREDVFDRITYEKGGAILHYLNGLMGDSAFYKAMNIYLTKNALHSAEVANWRMAVEEATGQDWNWFFNEWYFRGGHPELDIKYDYNDSSKELTVHVNQSQADSGGATYRLPLKTMLIYGNETEIVDWNIAYANETFSYSYKNGIKPVVVPDVRHWIVGIVRDHKQLSNWLVQYNTCEDYFNKIRAVETAYLHEKDSSSAEIFHLALQDTLPGIKESALVYLKTVEYSVWRKRFEPQVSFLAYNDTKNAVRAAAFNVLTAWKVKPDAEQLTQAIDDSSYAVAGAALNALYSVDSDKAYNVARALLNQNPRSTLESTVWSIIGLQAKDDDIDLFQKASIYKYGAQKFSLAAGLYYYLKKVKSDESFEKGVDALTNMAINDGIKNYRLQLGIWLISLKGEFAEDKKADKDQQEFAAKRRATTQKYIDKLMSAETDESNLKRYREMLQKQ
jgi:aminopeptidase N